MKQCGKLCGMVFLFWASLTSLTMAQEPMADGWQLSVGGATVAVDLPWKSLDTQVAALPYFSAVNGNWSFGVDNLARYQLKNQNSAVFLGINLRDAGYRSDFSVFRKESNHRVFDGYKSPDAEAVVQFGGNWRWFHLVGEQDISNQSRSTAATAAIEIPLFQGMRGGALKTKVFANWLSEDYVNYYYGISKAQENLAVDRSFYQTDAAVNYGASINAIYPFAMRWAVVSELTYTRLDDNIVDSPLVGQSFMASAVVSVVYRF